MPLADINLRHEKHTQQGGEKQGNGAQIVPSMVPLASGNGALRCASGNRQKSNFGFFQFGNLKESVFVKHFVGFHEKLGIE